MLDPLASQNLLQMVSRINRELGVAVIICEHRLEEVFQTADRVLLMEKGQIQLSGYSAMGGRGIIKKSDRLHQRTYQESIRGYPGQSGSSAD